MTGVGCLRDLLAARRFEISQCKPPDITSAVESAVWLMSSAIYPAVHKWPPIPVFDRLEFVLTIQDGLQFSLFVAQDSGEFGPLMLR